MTDAIAHRGPDGEGSWINNSANVVLGSRRLSIIDLTLTGDQPMHLNNRYSIVHNGEIYNYLELRDDLRKRGYIFQSGTDTEVILAAFDKYREECLQYFDGMFAFAIWDQQEQVLFCARDRFGEKPFYYHFGDTSFMFASERKALWAAGVEKKINNPLLLTYLSSGLSSTPADSTITFHQDIFSLPPSHYIKIQLPTLSFTMNRYWDGDKQSRLKISDDDAIEQLTALFNTSVSRRLRSDVTIGISLSGGLDSSTIASFVSAIGDRETKYNSFSAVFPGFEKDESRYVEMVCKSLGLKAHSITPTADGFAKDLAKLCYHQEEPFSSSSVYAQFKVAELAASQNVKVLLDGQGADEIFAGYPRYIPWYLQEVLKTSPRTFGSELKAFKHHKIPFHWGFKNYVAAFFPLYVPRFLHKREARKTLAQPDISRAFKQAYFDSAAIYKPLIMGLNDALYFSTFQFGLEELLRVEDRNAMAFGRESRLPFLSHELVSYAGLLAPNLKMRSGWTKWILRKMSESKLPGEITWRKEKVAYETPQRKWMETPDVKECLHEGKKKLVSENILIPDVLNKKNRPHDAHAADDFDWRYLIAAQFL